MKRYGDNLPSNPLDELENNSDKTVQYLAGNCAVRQDMVAFLISADPPSKPRKHTAWNIFSFFRIGQKKIKENGD
jgi:hypothetical protein